MASPGWAWLNMEQPLESELEAYDFEDEVRNLGNAWLGVQHKSRAVIDDRWETSTVARKVSAISRPNSCPIER